MYLCCDLDREVGWLKWRTGKRRTNSAIFVFVIKQLHAKKLHFPFQQLVLHILVLHFSVLHFPILHFAPSDFNPNLVLLFSGRPFSGPPFSAHPVRLRHVIGCVTTGFPIFHFLSRCCIWTEVRSIITYDHDVSVVRTPSPCYWCCDRCVQMMCYRWENAVRRLQLTNGVWRSWTKVCGQLCSDERTSS